MLKWGSKPKPYIAGIFQIWWAPVGFEELARGLETIGTTEKYFKWIITQNNTQGWWIVQIDQIWRIWAIYHRLHDILVWKRGWSMVDLPEKEAAWAIYHRSTLFPGAAAYLLPRPDARDFSCAVCGFSQVFPETLRQKTCQEIGLSLEESLGEGKIC